MAGTIDPFRKDDERYASILALAADAIICVDEQHRIVLFNAGAETTFGVPAADMLGQPVETLIPQRFRRRHAQHVSEFERGSSPARHMGDRQAIYGVRKSGEEFPAEATISKVVGPQGALLTVVLRDISERVQAETLREQDARKLRQALKAGRLGGFEQIPGGEQIRLFGDASAILGIDRSECHLEEIEALVHEEDRANVDAAFRDSESSGSFELEFRIRRADGAVAWVRSAGTRVRDDLKTSVLFGTVQDITHQKDVEHELERRVAERTRALEAEVQHREETQKQLSIAQRMEAFGQLTGGIAHDFNNLLTVAGGNLELLQEQVVGERPQRQVKRALEAVGMGARLTQRLLTFARRSNLEPEILNLNDQVINVIDLLRRTIGEAITISSVLTPDLDHVKADPSQVENAILNLAINARDAMPNGGTLLIETQNLKVDSRFAGPGQGDAIIPGDYVRLSVADSGSGMLPEVLAKAFEPFFTTKEHGRGTGLGLATVYGFARQSGGWVTIDSAVGLGTTVNIFLPRSEPPATDTPDRPPTSFASRDKRILVVEDNPEVREVTLQRLEKLGYRVLSCDSGPSAVRILKTKTALDLVFSDIMMAGGMSGHDLADWVISNRPELKVLLTTGFSDVMARPVERGREVRILQKPYGIHDLVAALDQVFDDR